MNGNPGGARLFERRVRLFFVLPNKTYHNYPPQRGMIYQPVQAASRASFFATSFLSLKASKSWSVRSG